MRQHGMHEGRWATSQTMVLGSHQKAPPALTDSVVAAQCVARMLCHPESLNAHYKHRQCSHHRKLENKIFALEAAIKLSKLSKVLNVGTVYSVKDTPRVATVAVVEGVRQDVNQHHVLLVGQLFSYEVLDEFEIDHVVQRLGFACLRTPKGTKKQHPCRKPVRAELGQYTSQEVQRAAARAA